MLNEFLNDKIKSEYGLEQYNKVLEGYSNKRYLTLRVNTLKANKEQIINVFVEKSIAYNEVSFYDDAFIILNKTLEEIKELDIYKDGMIYIQSLSSMIPPLVLDPKENENILDMTAAPGSKTSQLAALSNNVSLITAVEKDKIRCERLKYNLEKLGVKKVNVMNIDALNIDENYKFDKILLDAPCTGTGTISINDDITLNDDYLKKTTSKQLKLINKALKLLKKGGILIYSTCSILKEENEMIIYEVLKNENLCLEEIDMDVLKLSSTLKEVITVMPNKYYEGFFVAKIKKMC